MIRLRTLGTVHLEDDQGRNVRSVLAQPKRLLLLAYLVVARPRGLHRRDTLLALFWPESDEGHARLNLRTALHFLRRSLGSDTLAGDGTTVGVAEGTVWCDAVAFDAAFSGGELETAVDSYSGDFLKGLHADGSVELERWLEAERNRLRRQAVAAAVNVSRGHEAAERYREAIGWMRKAAAWVPYDETVHRQLLRTLDRSGDRAGAIREHDIFRERLAEDLDLRPSPETQALLEAILCRTKRNASLRGAEAANAGAGGPGLEGSDPTPLVPQRSDASTGPIAHEHGSGGSAVDGARPRVRHKSKAAWLALLIAAALGGGTLLSGRPTNPEASRVLVAVFENRTGDPKLDAVGRIAADWVTQGLADANLVPFVTSATAFLAEPPRDDRPSSDAGGPRLLELARETDSGILVSGSYHRRGDSLRFQTQIIDGRNGEILFTVAPVAAPVEDPTNALGVVRERIMGGLAAAGQRRLAGWTEQGGRAPTYDAYREFLAGLDIVLDRYHRPWALALQDIQRATRHFERASEVDSTFVHPLVWALTVQLKVATNSIPAERILSEIQLRAHLLSRLDRVVVAAQSAVVHGDWERAHRAWGRVLELAPSSIFALDAARAAIATNRPGVAIASLSKLDPERGWLRNAQYEYLELMAEAHHMTGHYAAELAAVEQLRRIRPQALRPLTAEARARAALGQLAELRRLVDARPYVEEDAIYPAWAMLAAAIELRAHGRHAASREFFDRAYEWFRDSPLTDPEPGSYKYGMEQYAHFLSTAGRWNEARPLFQELDRMEPPWWHYFNRAELGVVSARLGDTAAARRIADWLETEVESNLDDYDRWGGKFSRAEPVVYRARIAEALGERERAITLFREAIARGYRFGAGTHAGWWELAEDPRMSELLRPRE